MEHSSKILVVGHGDVLERSLVEGLRSRGFTKVFSSSERPLDVLNQQQVGLFFQKEKPEYVFLGSVRSGGIQANQEHAGEFLYCNVMSQTNVIESARREGTKKLLYIGSSCVYPKDAAQPIKEEFLLTGPLEESSGPYAMAKLAGIKQCQAYHQQYGFNAIVMIPATVYGPGSDTDPQKAHVLGALLQKLTHAVKNQDSEVVVWGSGQPRREFLYSDDFVEACLFLMERYDRQAIMNVGSGADVTIQELVKIIARVTGFRGRIEFDQSKPDGVFQKLLDSQKVHKLGWRPKVDLESGIEKTYQWLKKSKP